MTSSSLKQLKNWKGVALNFYGLKRPLIKQDLMK